MFTGDFLNETLNFPVGTMLEEQSNLKLIGSCHMELASQSKILSKQLQNLNVDGVGSPNLNFFNSFLDGAQSSLQFGLILVTAQDAK